MRPKEGLRMKNARSLIGLPVILESRELGRVSAVDPEDDLRALRGIYFSCGFMGTRFVPRDKLDLIGDVAVLVHAPGRKSRPTARGSAQSRTPSWTRRPSRFPCWNCRADISTI